MREELDLVDTAEFDCKLNFPSSITMEQKISGSGGDGQQKYVGRKSEKNVI